MINIYLTDDDIKAILAAFAAYKKELQVTALTPYEQFNNKLLEMTRIHNIEKRLGIK